MIFDFSSDLLRIALPFSTPLMAFASALFGFLTWRSEGGRRRAEARRARLETTIDDPSELFTAIPHDKSQLQPRPQGREGLPRSGMEQVQDRDRNQKLRSTGT